MNYPAASCGELSPQRTFPESGHAAIKNFFSVANDIAELAGRQANE